MVPVAAGVGRTSLDLELDLAASKTCLSQEEEEIARLKDIKQLLEHAKQIGEEKEEEEMGSSRQDR